MTQSDVITILKTSLNLVRTNDALDQHLEHLVNSAIGFIEREGYTFTTSDDAHEFTAEEAQLVIMYASFLYRKRATDEGMPRSLRWTLNNAILSQKARES